MRTLFGVIFALASMLGSSLAPAGSIAERDESPVCTKHDARKAMRAVVNLFRDLPPEEEYEAVNGGFVDKVSGSAWRVNARHIATVSHVVEGLRLSKHEWKEVVLRQSDEEYGAPREIQKTRARVRAVGLPNGEEAVALVELEHPLPESVTRAKQRFTPLKADESVMAIGYSSQTLRFVTGKLAYPKESPDAPEGKDNLTLIPFELADEEKNDRLAVDHGSSGGPIFDCAGAVVALIAKNRTRDITKDEALKNMYRSIRSIVGPDVKLPETISSAWGEYNVLGLSVTEVPPGAAP